MKTLFNTYGFRAMPGIVLGCAVLLAACIGDAGLGLSAESKTEVQLTGQVPCARGALVTTHQVDASGGIGPAVDSTRADSNGSFCLPTRLRGEQALIVLVKLHDSTWMARFEDRLAGGTEKALGVLDARSTADAAVWAELRATAQGRAVPSADIRGAVDAYADSLGLAGIQGNLEERSLLVARIVLLAKARTHAIASLAVHAGS